MQTDWISAALGVWSAELGLTAIVLRIVLSVAFTAIIGCERSSKRHSAGLRTFILVAGGNGNHAARPVLNAEYWRNCTGAVCGCGDRNGDDQWKLDPL